MTMRVLSVSYNKALLVTREALLRQHGYSVVSADSFPDSAQRCAEGGYDLFVLGHSIPVADKIELINTYRQSSPGGRILSLMRGGDAPIEAADNHVFSDDPQDFLAAVKLTISRSTLGGFRQVRL